MSLVHDYPGLICSDAKFQDLPLTLDPCCVFLLEPCNLQHNLTYAALVVSMEFWDLERSNLYLPKHKFWHLLDCFNLIMTYFSNLLACHISLIMDSGH